MPELDYRALKRRAQSELQRQKNIMRWVLFAVNLMLYLLLMVIGWGMFLNSGVDFTPELFGTSSTSSGELLVSGMIMVSLTGGLGLMFQFISAFVETRIGEAKMRERIMGRLVTEEILRLGEESDTLDEEKAKRNLSINDEGELEEVMSDEEIADLEARRSQSRK